MRPAHSAVCDPVAPGIYAADRSLVDGCAPAHRRWPQRMMFTATTSTPTIWRGAALLAIFVVAAGVRSMWWMTASCRWAILIRWPMPWPCCARAGCRAQLIREVSPMLYSFMSESRRIDNPHENASCLRLAYPTPAHFLRQMKPAAALQRTLL